MPGLNNLLNVHPLFVHFPIALTLAAALFIILHLATRRADFISMGSSLIYLAAVSAIVTIITGYNAAAAIGHDAPNHDLVHAHRDIMLWYTVLIVALAVLQWLVRSSLWGWLSHWGVKATRLLLLAAAVVMLIIGTDRGGQLVFQYGMGVRMTEEKPSVDLDAGSDQIDDGQKKPENEHDHSTHEH